MRIILYSAVNGAAIRDSLGKPEYSYFFVLKAFQPVLEQIGEVTVVEGPEEVDPIFMACEASGEACVFICFSPPNFVPLDLKCPSIVVFAWEFSTIPDGGWNGADFRDDWRVVFGQLGFAISLSSFSAEVVRNAMGKDFPVFAITAPVWNRMSLPITSETGDEILSSGIVIDSCDYAFSAAAGTAPFIMPIAINAPEIIQPVEVEPAMPLELTMPEIAPEPPPRRRGPKERLAITKRHMLEWYREAIRDLLPPIMVRGASWLGGLVYRLRHRGVDLSAAVQPVTPAPAPIILTVPAPPKLCAVRLSGVVYTSLFNPADGRKNWHDLLTAFCWAFRDVEDATLVLKLVKDPVRDYRRELLLLLTRLSPFKCRVVTIDGFLEEDEYRKLIAASHYYVNVSNAEGLCLPLMEFMSVGVPVIAPRHTAMLDYIDERAAFLVDSAPEHNVWPNDPRHAYTTIRQRPKWDTIVTAFLESYRVVSQNPELYAVMSRDATRIMRDYSADDVIRAQLAPVLRAVVENAKSRVAVLVTEDPPPQLSKNAEADLELLQPITT